MFESYLPSLTLDECGAVVDATLGSPGNAGRLALEERRGKPLVAHLAERLDQLGLVVVVVQVEADAALLDGYENVAVVIDPEWQEGSAAPLRAGLDYLAHATSLEAAFVLPMNVPLVESAALEELAAALAAHETLAAVPKYRYVRGLPILVKRDLWPRLLGAEGDIDLEHLIQAHPDWATEVRVDFAPPTRISTADQLAELSR